MESKASLKISIAYQLTDSAVWHLLELTPDRYFRLEQNEKSQLRSSPKYNHAFEYLNLERDRLSGTKIILTDNASKAKSYIVERFWNNGKNRLIEKTDIDRQIYGETILEIMVGKEPPLWEIVKVIRQDGILTSWYRGFSPNPDNKDEEEEKLISSAGGKGFADRQSAIGNKLSDRKSELTA
ncbi:MAG: hypothetical protein F6J93_29725 [Oscillatoria sp. SIO1A7]|nr:hypothetical protein [Oscillatoria sp. SIO1A7]